MCYTGSAGNHKTQGGMPCGDHSAERADTQILFGEALRFFDERAPAAAPGDDPVQLREREQLQDDGLRGDRFGPPDNL